jgi:hydrogenase maturation protease
MLKKILVLGIGNTICGDDGAGIQAVRSLKKELDKTLNKTVDIKEMEEANINILELLEGYKKLIIVDSICTKKAKAGAIRKLSPLNFKEENQPYSSHQIGFNRVMDMAKTFKMDVPEEIIIYAMEIKKTASFKNGLSLIAKKALQGLVGLIKREVLLNN